MKKQKVILALFALCFTSLVCADVPVVDYSTDANDNSAANVGGNNGNNSSTIVIPAIPASSTQQQGASYEQIPSEQVAQASMGQQNLSSKVTSVPSSQNNVVTIPPVVDTSKMAIQQRIQRLEQQVNYINNSQVNLDDLQQKLQKAQGGLEVQQHKIDQLEKQLNDFYSDLDQRINKTKTSSVATKNRVIAKEVNVGGNNNVTVTDATEESAAPATQVTTKPITKKKKNPTPIMKETSKLADARVDQPAVVDSGNVDNVAAAAATTATVAVSSTTAKKNNSVQEQQAYQAAFDSLQNKQYDTAAKKLKGYLASYPDGVYAGNAHYWLGEIYFQGNSYAKASTEFDNVVSKYSSSSKVPEAMFKLAYIHDKEGKHAQAQNEYQELKKHFPKSGVAKLADEQLAAKN